MNSRMSLTTISMTSLVKKYFSAPPNGDMPL